MPPRLQRLGRYASDWRRHRLVGNDPGYRYVRCVCFIAVARQHVLGGCARTFTCKELTFLATTFAEAWARRK